MKCSSKFIITTVIFLISAEYFFAQTPQFRVLFFNTENYFDNFDDSITLDDDFTPQGLYHWTWNRFYAKRNALAKIIIATGKGKMPSIIGLCEIENRFVLSQLINETPLSKFKYGIVHRDSPDTRGIDVAMLYNHDDFELLHQNFYSISTEFDTREILYAKGIMANADTLHVFVNHFPSKRGGAVASEPRRITAAAKLKHICDSLFAANSNANILIMGDFNDTPNSNPVTKTLDAKSDFKHIVPSTLYNLAFELMQQGDGSIKFQGVWEFIDLMFVSSNMLSEENKINCKQSDFNVFKAPYLLEKDNAYLGNKPKRTYTGLKYNGGISDHFPVCLQLTVKSSDSSK